MADFVGIFLEIDHLALIWRACCYSNNKVIKKWANGKAINIMTSAQFFAA